uniref:Uncharacterized protein n=1 Tax=Panagrolaimus sp. ES5 TaxID=591445 RepID=A0AC34F3A1_9BILA
MDTFANQQPPLPSPSPNNSGCRHGYHEEEKSTTRSSTTLSQPSSHFRQNATTTSRQTNKKFEPYSQSRCRQRSGFIPYGSLQEQHQEQRPQQAAAFVPYSSLNEKERSPQQFGNYGYENTNNGRPQQPPWHSNDGRNANSHRNNYPNFNQNYQPTTSFNNQSNRGGDRRTPAPESNRGRSRTPGPRFNNDRGRTPVNDVFDTTKNYSSNQRQYRGQNQRGRNNYNNTGRGRGRGQARTPAYNQRSRTPNNDGFENRRPPPRASSRAPSVVPSRAPSRAPSCAPSRAASRAPSRAASRPPSRAASRAPSRAASKAPSRAASQQPAKRRQTKAKNKKASSRTSASKKSKIPYGEIELSCHVSGMMDIFCNEIIDDAFVPNVFAHPEVITYENEFNDVAQLIDYLCKN